MLVFISGKLRAQSARGADEHEVGGASRDRTDDLKLAKLALSQLSYGPGRSGQGACPRMVGLGRLERPTSPLSGVRSNHLSYRPDASSTDERRRTSHVHSQLLPEVSTSEN